MKRLSATLLLVSGLTLAAAAPAQTANEHAGHHPAAAQAAPADLADGEIRKIDKAAGKLTIKHGPIKSLDMPSMTMVYQVKDKTMLDTVRVGDKVRFRAESENGKYLVAHIQPAN